MITHFIKIAWRNIMRRKGLSFIQIMCLSVGLTAFILIARYVQYEKDWDKIHQNFSRIYRVQSYKPGDRTSVNISTMVPLSNYLKDNVPEIDNAIMIQRIWGEYLSSDAEHIFDEPDGYIAPSDIFKIFSFKLLRGDINTVLNEPNAIVLSEELAQKYFPNQDALGKILFDQQKSELVVTGIMKNVPEQTEIRASYFRSSTNLLKTQANSWTNNSYSTYVLLKPNVSARLVSDKISDIGIKFNKEAKRILYLKPLADLHLKESPTDDRGSVIYFFSFIGILTLLLACISFMNLTTSFSTLRSVEIGIRKVSGSNKNYIRLQFLAEAVVLSFLSFGLAVFMSYLILPEFNNVVNRHIEMNLLNNPTLIVILLIAVVITGILAGSYPALVVARFKPVKVLKSQNPFKKGNASGLKVMVYFQFILSVVLLTSSIWMYKQVQFMKNKDVGFKKNNLLYCSIPANHSAISFSQVRQRLMENPEIEDVAFSYNSPMHSDWGTNIRYENGPTDDYLNARWNTASYNYLNTMGMQLVEGRNFSRNYKAEQFNCLINETALKAFGWNDPIGKWISNGNRYQVIGVIKDFNIQDVHNAIKPYILYCRDDQFSDNNDITIRLTTHNMQKNIAYVNRTLHDIFPTVLFEVSDFDTSSYDIAIQIWTSAKDTFSFFTVLAIIIAVLGLFGLVVFTTQRRNKEIGIRKTQGAKAYQILPLITRNFIILVIIANINVLPLAYLLERVTPGHFKYHFAINDILMVLSISLLVTIIASGYQAFKAAMLNPVKALRYE